MAIIKTPYDSYKLNNLPRGCELCIRGEKLVLFMTGLCKRGCCYCPLSKKRKGKDTIWANERECKNINEVIEEAKISKAKGAGITGGDPLEKLSRTIKFAKELKKNFKNFHIHIYVSTKLVNREKIRRLSRVVDEIRFHPDIFSEYKEQRIEKEIEKIKIAKEFFKRNRIGIELPLFPDRKKETFNFIKKIRPFIGFVNLNELEIGDSNFNFIIKKYRMNPGGYTVNKSIASGLWILKMCEKEKFKINIHLCTAKTKNWHQYKNRLLKHKILPYGKRTKDGTVIYYAIYNKTKKDYKKIKRIYRDVYYDEKKKRIIVWDKLIDKINKDIKKVEEFPTYDAMEVEVEDV